MSAQQSHNAAGVLQASTFQLPAYCVLTATGSCWRLQRAALTVLQMSKRGAAMHEV